MSQKTVRHQDVLWEALGIVNGKAEGYKNHFVGETVDRADKARLAVREGLMVEHAPSGGGSPWFTVTRKGLAHVGWEGSRRKAATP